MAGAIPVVVVAGTVVSTTACVTGGAVGSHVGTVIVSERRVTPPLVDRTRPSTVVPAPMTMPACAMIVPPKLESAPIVVAPPSCQKTSQDWAPLVSVTRLIGAAVNAALV
jgi:hypothetical protein